LQTLFNEVTQTDCRDDDTLLSDTFVTPSHCDKPADNVLVHLPFTPAAEADFKLHILIPFAVAFFVPGTSTTSLIARELLDGTLLFPSTTKYIGGLEEVGSLAVNTLLTGVLFRPADITTGETLRRTVMCGRLLTGEFTVDKGTNGRGLITALFSTEYGILAVRTLSDMRHAV